jgi:hypothetical protein
MHGSVFLLLSNTYPFHTIIDIFPVSKNGWAGLHVICTTSFDQAKFDRGKGIPTADNEHRNSGQHARGASDRLG